MNVQVFAARTQTFGPGGDDAAYRAALLYSGNRFGFSGDYMVIGPETNAEMGFITRTDIRRFSGDGRVTFRPLRLGVRRVSCFMIGNYVTRLSGEIQDRNLGQFIETELESGETIAFFRFLGFSRLDEGFDLSDRIPVPVGDYSLRQHGFMASTSRKRALALLVMAGDRWNFGGRIRSAQTECTIAQNAHVSLRTGYTFSRVRLPAGRFDSHVGSVRFVWAFSTHLSAQILVQYNSLDRKILTNARLHFIHHPGSDLFLVWNEERGSSSSVWTFGRRDAAVKLTYLMRL